jgi:dipeptidase D
LQAHADMVAVKKITSKHDFQKDPIIPLYKDGYLYAKDTNLGADNGSGVAMIMALATDLSYHHGPLEIIVTVQEEVGLVGAKNIESSLIKGKYLINFDGGNKDITMGCNGGIKLNGILNITRQLVTSKENILCLRLYGLLGGHSAQQAKFNHLNAFKGMGYILFNLQNHFKIHLINLKNVSLQAQIPTTCEAYITVDKQDINKIKNKIQVLLDELKEMYQVEKNIQFSNETIKEIDSKKISLLDSKKIINLIYTLPDGQQTFNIHFQKTECSSSINNIYLTNKECYVVIGCRGLFESQKYQLCNQIKQIIELHNGRVELSGDTKG